MEEVAQQLAESYAKDYDDQFLVRDIAAAARNVSRFLQGVMRLIR